MYNLLGLMTSASTEADVFNANAITDLSNAMNKYGVVTVIIAAMVVAIGVFITYVLHHNKKQSNEIAKMLQQQNEITTEMLKKNNETIIDQNNLLIDKVVQLTEQQKKDETAERKLVDIFMRLNVALKEECHETQEILKCARVGVYACHNGAKTNTGLPFFKTTCVSEWVSKKYLMMGKVGTHTDLQMGMFYNLVSHVFVDGFYVIHDVEELHTTEFNAYKYLAGTGAMSSVIVAIVNNDGNHMGSVVIEFDDVLDDENKVSEAIQAGKDLSEKIIPLLDYSLYTVDDIEQMR